MSKASVITPTAAWRFQQDYVLRVQVGALAPFDFRGISTSGSSTLRPLPARYDLWNTQTSLWDWNPTIRPPAACRPWPGWVGRCREGCVATTALPMAAHRGTALQESGTFPFRARPPRCVDVQSCGAERCQARLLHPWGKPVGRWRLLQASGLEPVLHTWFGHCPENQHKPRQTSICSYSTMNWEIKWSPES